MFEKVTKSSVSAVVAAVVTALAFFALWFGFTFFRRQQQTVPAKESRSAD